MVIVKKIRYTALGTNILQRAIGSCETSVDKNDRFNWYGSSEDSSRGKGLETKEVGLA